MGKRRLDLALGGGGTTREVIKNNLDWGANGDGAEGNNGGKLELQPSWPDQRKPLPGAGCCNPSPQPPNIGTC